jgi:hypothetical protein
MRRFATTVVVTAVLALSGVASSIAGAGELPLAPLTIEKVVAGTAPPGTTFVVLVECDADIIDDGEGGGPTSSALVVFDANGVPAGPNVFELLGDGTCTVQENVAGGATSVTYACEGGLNESPMEMDEASSGGDVVASGPPAFEPCASVTASGVEITVETETQFATVTVTNTFASTPTPPPPPPPGPAAAVVAQPRLTG